MIPFAYNENQFSFFVADHQLVGQLCINPKRDRSPLLCLKVTQCSTSEIGDALLYNSCFLPIKVMTTGPLPATFKMQIRTFQRAQGDENKVSGYGYGLWCGFKWGPHHATSHLRSRLESQHQGVPVCAEECGDPLVQSGGWWQTLGVAARLGAGPQVQRALDLASEGVLQLCTLLSLAPLLPRPEPAGLLWSYVENITNTKASLIAAIRRVFAELLPALVERHAHSSGSVSRRWLRVKAATLNRCQLSYIIKLPELIFSIKVLK